MAGKNIAVFGIYKTGDAAERGVDALIGGGFLSGDISVLLPVTRSSREFAHQKETKAPEGAAAGVTAGGVIGGTLGVLAGVGALAIPGLGPFIAAGPIVAGLAGLGVGGAVGGLMGALIGMGIPEYEAKRYEGRVRNGGNLRGGPVGPRGSVTSAHESISPQRSAALTAPKKSRSSTMFMPSGLDCALHTTTTICSLGFR